MFQPLECFIGLRYLRSRKARGVVSFMSAASLCGIALGVAALIVILSVMNGFETELRSRLLSLSSHASISDSAAGIEDWESLRAELSSDPVVAGVAPYVLLEGLLATGSNRRPAMLRGIDPSLEPAVSEVAAIVSEETLAGLAPGSNRIVLGRGLAASMGAVVGDRVIVYVPKMERGRPAMRPAAFVVSGFFQAGIGQHDSNLALIALDAASRLDGLSGRPEGVALRMHDPMQVIDAAARIESGMAAGLRYSDWTREHRSQFRAIRLEKIMMTVILMLIVAVAAFNIVASLVMVVTDKERDIAILRTCGLEPARVSRIFLVQGWMIGIGGTLIGTALGLVLAFNVDTIVPWLESTFSFKIMPGDVYYVTEIPSEIHLFDVVTVPVMAMLVSLAATIYPSRRAAKIAPAEALRYE